MQDGTAREENFAKLHAVYQTEWRNYSVEASRWRSLQEGADADSNRVHTAEAAVRSAEERYRAARNALGDYLLEQSAETMCVGC